MGKRIHCIDLQGNAMQRCVQYIQAVETNRGIQFTDKPGRVIRLLRKNFIMLPGRQLRQVNHAKHHFAGKDTLKDNYFSLR